MVFRSSSAKTSEPSSACVRPSAEFPVEAAPARSALKRGIDLLVAVVALAILAPLLTVAIVAISLESPGSPIFTQWRTGLCGGRFKIFKLRTMLCDTDKAPEVRPAAISDPRITRIGALLRRSSIDELPQLLNVILGDMSLVGPRPHAIEHDQVYCREIPDYNFRFAVRPGLTGLAQISGSRGGGDINEIRRRVALDLAYIRRWSIGRDLKIIALTLPHLVWYKAH